MPKLKTHKGMAKRIRITRNGKLIRAHALKSHLLEKKSSKRKRNYRAAQAASPADATQIRRLLGA
jgi:large subunit ribosomal protein L35